MCAIPAVASISWAVPPSDAASVATVTRTAAAVSAARATPGAAGAAGAPGSTNTRGRGPRLAVVALSHLGGVSRYAFLERAVAIRAAPSAHSRALGQLRTGTFWGTSTIVQALAQTQGGRAGSWTRVRAAYAPHDVVGWVPTRDLSALHEVHTWMRVNRERLTLTLIRDGRVVFRAPVGVGQPQWPTPAGQYFIEVAITPTEADGVYGAFAFGTSAHSNVLTEWPNEGQIGVHGTNEPWLIPGRISHGCIRLRNPDIAHLERLMPVGTPVTIE